MHKTSSAQQVKKPAAPPLSRRESFRTSPVIIFGDGASFTAKNPKNFPSLSSPTSSSGKQQRSKKDSNRSRNSNTKNEASKCASSSPPKNCASTDESRLESPRSLSTDIAQEDAGSAPNADLSLLQIPVHNMLSNNETRCDADDMSPLPETAVSTVQPGDQFTKGLVPSVNPETNEREEVPVEYLLEQWIYDKNYYLDELCSGIHVLKVKYHDPKSKPQPRVLSIDLVGQNLCWGTWMRRHRRSIPLQQICWLVPGPNTDTMDSYTSAFKLDRFVLASCFSIRTETRTLDFIASNPPVAEAIICVLSYLCSGNIRRHGRPLFSPARLLWSRLYLLSASRREFLRLMVSCIQESAHNNNSSSSSSNGGSKSARKSNSVTFSSGAPEMDPVTSSSTSTSTSGSPPPFSTDESSPTFTPAPDPDPDSAPTLAPALALALGPVSEPVSGIEIST
eukprot:ANDGO_03299.mRNA.1 hypothetical protein